MTTVHALQVLDDGCIPMTAHDVPLDMIVTPGEIIDCGQTHTRPAGVLWDHVPHGKIDEIPLLRRLAAERG